MLTGDLHAPATVAVRSFLPTSGSHGRGPREPTGSLRLYEGLAGGGNRDLN